MRRSIGILSFVLVVLMPAVVHAAAEKVLAYDFAWQIDAEASQFIPVGGNPGYIEVRNGPLHTEGMADALVSELVLGLATPRAIWLYVEFVERDGHVLGHLVLAPIYGTSSRSLHQLMKTESSTEYAVVDGSLPVPDGLFDGMDLSTGGNPLQGGLVTFAPGARAVTVDYYQAAHSNTFGPSYSIVLAGDGELGHPKFAKEHARRR